MKNILITGGAGYIGSHTIVEILKDINYNVVVVDNFSNSNRQIIERIEKIINKRLKIYDIDCREDLTNIFSENKIDSIVHFAAFKSVNDSINRPLEYYDNNINSLINILKFCDKFNVKEIIFSSSCSLYGNVDTLPVDEMTKLSVPESPYANTKLIGENILKDVSKSNKDLKIISLRYFNPVGAHESGLIGESPINKPNNILPVICNSVQSGEEMVVFGNDYETPDGSCIRDYVHVSDIASAHYLAIKYMESNMNLNYEVFNLGSDKGFSVLELINSFEKENNLKVNYRIGNRRDGDVVKIYSDSSKSKNKLGWKIKFSIKEIVKSAWNWNKNKI